MPLFEFVFTEFDFPDALPDNKANFRFVADVRYVSAGDDPKFLTKQVLLPGADTFWECDKGESDKPNYVRPPSGDSRFDMSLLDDWDKNFLMLNAQRIQAIRFKAFDVNREGFWDKIKDVVGKLVEGLLGKFSKLASGVVPSFFTDAFGAAEDEVQSYLLKKIVGGDDKVLYKGSKVTGFPTAVGTTSCTIGGPGPRGRGTRGQYQIDFEVRVS